MADRESGRRRPRSARALAAGPAPAPAIAAAGRAIAQEARRTGRALEPGRWRRLAAAATGRTPRTAEAGLIAEQALARLIDAAPAGALAREGARAALTRLACAKGARHAAGPREDLALLAAAGTALDARHGVRLAATGARPDLPLSVARHMAGHAVRPHAGPPAAPADRVLHTEDASAPAALDALGWVRPGGRLVAITPARPAPDAWPAHRRDAPAYTVVATARVGARARLTVIDRSPPAAGHTPLHAALAGDEAVEWARSIPPAPYTDTGSDPEDDAAPRRADAGVADECRCAVPHPGPLAAAGERTAWTPARRWSAPAHPAPLTEAAGLAAVAAHAPSPPPSARLRALGASAVLSDAQVEACALAEARWTTYLRAGRRTTRAGFLLADGTGTGKTRIAMALIAAAGRPKALWVTPSTRLVEPVTREAQAVGVEREHVFSAGDTAFGARIARTRGIAIATWASLSGEAPDPPGEGARLDAAVAWLGAGFDGVIVLDEAHLAGTDPRSRAAALTARLHRALPDARILYASATIARTAGALGACERLGLWGCEGAPWPDRGALAAAARSPALAAACTRWLKRRGALCARDLSLAGIRIAPLEVALDDESRALYDRFAEAAAGARVPPSGRSEWEGARHRAFLALATALKAPAVARAMRADHGAGRASVVQLVHTEERALRGALAAGAEHVPGPRETLIAGALAAGAGAETVVRLQALPAVAGALDRLIWLTGAQRCAELTARRVRTVRGADRTLVTERRTEADARAELADFQAGRRTALIFSEAGGTGAQYAASAAGARPRVHYVLEPALGALAAVQGLGRTHRADQHTAPIYRPVRSSALAAEHRASAAIAARLTHLGAVARAAPAAERTAGALAQAVPAPEDARLALERLRADAACGRLDGWTAARLAERTGLAGGESADLTRWLNRVMALTIDEQASLEDALRTRLPAPRHARGDAARRTVLGCAAGPAGARIVLTERSGTLEAVLCGPSDDLEAERKACDAGGTDAVLRTSDTSGACLAGTALAARAACALAPELTALVDAYALWQVLSRRGSRAKLGNGWSIQGTAGRPLVQARGRRPSHADADARGRLRDVGALARLIGRYGLRSVACPPA